MNIDDAIDINVYPSGAKGSSVSTVNILYCIAWNYRSTYESIAKYIKSINPSIDVSGDEYPASQSNQLLASLIGYIQFGALIFVLFGQTIIDKLQFQVPEFVNSAINNKFMVGMAAFIVGNMIKGQLLATGAFEIYFDDQLVYSKLQTNAAPSQEMLETLLHTYNII